MSGVGANVTIKEVTASADLAKLATLAARVIGSDTVYISHGEIQTGLSENATSWSPNLERLFAEDFAALDDTRVVLAAYDAGGVPLGFAIVAWEETSRRRFAVLEDMAIEPAARSFGIGAQLLTAVEEYVELGGGGWLFLESGVRNERAHTFFERHGFVMTSHVFAKQCG
jgi:GNAT superfamily N-acetyltransferase